MSPRAGRRAKPAVLVKPMSIPGYSATVHEPLSEGKSGASPQMASVPSDDRRIFARVGRIDRSIQDVSSRPDMLCTFVTLDS